MMGQLNLGGSKLLQQVVWGPPIIRGLIQSVIYLTGPKVQSALDPSEIWAESSSRSRARSPASGWPNAAILWKEALGQVDKGWITPPPPAWEGSQLPGQAIGPIDLSFRFGGGQMNKLRAFDGRKYGAADEYCSAWAPVKLPTRGHIAQMAANVRQANSDWPFFKTNHESAYKQLPIGK